MHHGCDRLVGPARAVAPSHLLRPKPMMRSCWSSSHSSSSSVVSRAAAVLARTSCSQLQKGACIRTRPHPTRSSFSSFSSASAAGQAKVQLAGKPRFYRRVSVVPTRPPWIVENSGDDPKNNNGSFFVASPISAGVDGTDSATGVVVVDPAKKRRGQKHPQHLIKLKDGTMFDEDRRKWLQPRTPDGRKYASADLPLSASASWHAVCLDDKVLQTPARSLLAVPSRALASAIASEWNAQHPSLKPAQMPLTTLSCTILDQVSHQPTHYQESVLSYVNTDTLRYWSDPTLDPDLFGEQQRLWTPVLDRLQAILGREYPTQQADANVIIYSKNRHRRTHNGSLHDDELMDACRQWVESLDAWHLGILYALTVEAKSFGMAMAYLHPNAASAAADAGGGKNDDDDLSSHGFASRESHYVASCRVEEEVQIAQWGMVEGGHDYDRLNCSVQVRAAAFLHQCLRHELLLNSGVSQCE